MVNVDYNDVSAQRARLQEAFATVSDHLFTSNAIMWLWEVETKKFHINSSGSPLFSQNTSSLIDFEDFWKNVIHPDDRKDFILNTGKVIKTSRHGERFEFFYRVKSKGEYQWVLTKGRVLERNASGQAMRVMGVMLDMHSLSEINERIITQNARTAYALEATQGGLWDWKPDDNEVYYSHRYITMMGYTPDNFPHSIEAWAEKVHKDDIENIMRPQRACIESPEGGDAFEVIYRFMAADNTYRWILSRGKVIVRDETGRAKRLVGLHIDVTDLRAAQDALADLVNCDPLTKLGSRFAFDAAYSEIKNTDLPASLIYMDVDGLKMVNDGMGHSAGDSLLCRAADLIRNEFRSRDLVARIGGDEFVVLLKNCTHEAAQRLMMDLRQVCGIRNCSDDAMPILLSMGLASTEQGIDAADLLKEADEAMLEDKAANAAANYKILMSWLSKYMDRRLDPKSVRSFQSGAATAAVSQ